jgi:hypothetical protein
MGGSISVHPFGYHLMGSNGIEIRKDGYIERLRGKKSKKNYMHAHYIIHMRNQLAFLFLIFWIP